MHVVKEERTGGLILPTELKGSVMEFQRVVAVGSAVKEMKAGDMVHFNPMRYAVMKHKDGSMRDGIITDNPVVDYNVPTVTVGGETCMLVYDSDVDYVVEG